jgi:pyruvate dehydrogenase E2 component (dihydrolipoamide acetyltransferase)
MLDVTMPRLSDSMEEGTIVTWHVIDGAQVAVGQELAEVETDKATVSFEAEVAGTISLLVPEGETVPLGAVIARIAALGEAAEPGLPSAPPNTAPSPVAPPSPSTPAPSSLVGVGAGPAMARSAAVGERPLASPIARRVAVALGVDLGSVSGSGPRGRIVRGDVERTAQAASASNGLAAPAAQSLALSAPPPDAQPPTSSSTAKGETTTIELSRTQQVIARRMSESRATVPDFTVEVDVDMEAAWTLREQLKQVAVEEDAVVPSLNDMVVLACARALREQPTVNSSYHDGGIDLFSRVNVGVAIAAPGSLVVATVFDADRKSLGAIARTTRRLAEEVRDGTITPPDLAGATFTVSNLGMFGVDRFAAVVNTPQAAILAVGAMKERPVVREGGLVVRRRMTMSLSADHRVLYGADAARFLARMRELLEHPLATLVDG